MNEMYELASALFWVDIAVAAATCALLVPKPSRRTNHRRQKIERIAKATLVAGATLLPFVIRNILARSR